MLMFMRYLLLLASPLLLLLAVERTSAAAVVSAASSNANREVSTSPFEAAAYHLQQEYDRFERNELRLALLSGANAVRTDLIARDRAQFLQRLRDVVPDTVPADVQCDRVKYCDKNNVCAIVCARGSVVIDTWEAQTLRLQRKVAYERNFCTAQLPGSHNSAINIADGYGVEDHVFERYLKYLSWFKSGLHVHTNDQLFSLTDQLQMGVRFIELDVHWFDNDLRIAHCGGFRSELLDGFIAALNAVAKLLGTGIEWDSETIGCKPSLSSIPASEQRPLSAALEELATWLHAPANRDEFLLVFFDDEPNLQRWHKVEQLLELVTTHFSLDEILLPSDLVHGFDWPSYQELIDAGKRVVFMSGADYSPDGDALLFVKETICDWREPPLPFVPYPTCRFHRPNVGPLDETRTIFRPETSEIVYGFLNADGAIGANEYVLDEITLPPLVDCGVNLPSPDNITPKRMASTIWAVQQGASPLVRGQCIGILRNATSWQSVECDAPFMVAACVDKARPNNWRLGAYPVVEADSVESCVELVTHHHNMHYGVPASGYENRLVLNLLADAPATVAGVWIDAKVIVDDVYFGHLHPEQSNRTDAPPAAVATAAATAATAGPATAAVVEVSSRESLPRALVRAEHAVVAVE